jgi:adenosylhomocysteine nucleosidase
VDRNAPIGVVAVEPEAGPLLAALRPSRATQVGWVELQTGSWEGRPVVLARTLVGQVAGALAAQALVLRGQVGCLIACGSAGALVPGLRRGNIVVSRRVVPHDAGSFVGQHFVPVGSMVRDGRGRPGYRQAFYAPADLVHQARRAAATQYGEAAVRVGTLASGNQGIFAPARRDWLHATFDALAVDMESAGVAAVAEAFDLPWIAVRCVSDAASLPEWFDFRVALRYLDDARPAWRKRLARLGVGVRHPALWREGRRLQRGLRVAADRASQVVLTMVSRL